MENIERIYTQLLFSTIRLSLPNRNPVNITHKFKNLDLNKTMKVGNLGR